MNYTIEDEYREWLVNLVSEWCSPYGSYQKLLNYLYSRTFYAKIDNDNNRAIDGKDFRFRFTEQFPEYTYRDVHLYLDKPCTVLEMMVALACRCDEYIMWNPDEGDSSGKWFYEMLRSLHLDCMTDDYFFEEEAHDIITRLLERRYKPNGDGGLFTINTRSQDMRDVEIWFQLCWYLNEVIDE